MVHITKARQPQADGTEKIVYAALFQKGDDKVNPCLCPDPHCTARLSHVKAHRHTYHDEEGRRFEAHTPAYFRRHINSSPHDPGCAVLKQQEWLDHLAHKKYAHRPTRTEDGAADRITFFSLDLPGRGPRLPFPHTQGLRRIEEVAALLDNTMFDPGERAHIHIRRHDMVQPLAAMYYDNPVDLFRARYDDARKARAILEDRGLPESAKPAFLHFRPIEIPRRGKEIFHDSYARTVAGICGFQRGKDAVRYAVSMRLNFATSALYRDFKDRMEEGQRSFLVQSDAIWIDLPAFAKRKAEIAQGGKNRSIFVEAGVDFAAQICAWKPRSPQHDFSTHIDLPVARKPPRDQDFTPIGP